MICSRQGQTARSPRSHPQATGEAEAGAQRTLTRLEEQDYLKHFCDEVLQSILSLQTQTALDLLERSNSTTIMQVVDSNGMHAVHHAPKVWPRCRR